MKCSLVQTPGGSRWRVDWREAGRRRRRFFPSQRQAQDWARRVRNESAKLGRDWLSLRPRDRAEVLSVWGEVRDAGLSLRAVWESWRTRAPVAEVALLDAIEAVLAAKASANRRPRYLVELEGYLRLFARGRERMAISAISPGDIEAWFAGRRESPVTRAGNLGKLGALFSYAFRRGWIQVNPALRVERVSVERGPPAILSVMQAARLLVAARDHVPRFLASLALMLFAGVRPDEVGRLTWAAVNLDRGRLTIDAAASKVRLRRIVELRPAALAWLRVARALGSPLPVTARRRLRAAVCSRARVRLRQDVLRHTAASMMLAAGSDVSRVASDLGTSPRMLFLHYRELVPAEVAARFWGLIPR